MSDCKIGSCSVLLRSVEGQGVTRSLTIFAASTASVGFGVIVPLLGVDSWLTAVILTLMTVVLVGSCVVLINAAKGKAWAIGLFLAANVFLIEATFRQREITAQNIDAQTFMKLCVWISCFVIAAIAVRNIWRKLFQGDLKYLSIFSIYALVSATYSLSPAYTFGAGVAAMAYCVLASIAVERLTQQEILWSLLAGMSVLFILSLLLLGMGAGLAEMEGGRVLRLAGIAGSPNGLGRTAALAIIVVGVLVLQYGVSLTDWRVTLPFCIALACLGYSDSRTSMIAVGGAAALWFFRRHYLFAVVVFTVLLALAVIIANSESAIHMIGSGLSRTGNVTEITTLTGRSDIWGVSFDAFLASPLFGYGFGASKVLLPEIYRTPWGFTVTQTHNLYLQAAVTLGVFGLLLVLVVIWRQAVVYWRNPTMFQAAVLGYILVQGLTEAGPLGPAPNIVTLFWALSLCWGRASDDTPNYGIEVSKR